MATFIKSFRIRVYPNSAQQRMLDRWFGASRWLWNTALGIRSAAYRLFRLNLAGNEVSLWLTQWKQTPGHEWLAEVPATCLTQCLRDLDRAFANFFAKRARYPKFKRRRTRGGLRFQDIGASWERGTLSLPKLGKLKLAESLPRVKGEDPERAFVARPDMVTLSRDAAGRYHVSFCAELEIEPLPSTGRAVGVDLGLIHLATLSTGTKFPAPKRYFARQRYLKHQQRVLARKQPGSHRQEKQKLKVAKAAAQVVGRRTNDLHQLTTSLVREFDIIIIENLNVKALARGMHAKSIHDAAFSAFARQLAYKSSWYGRTVIAVDRMFPSSKLCSRCGHRLDELRLDQREWTCPKCGTVHDRDVNAAQNLLAQGLRQLAGSDARH
jgi:putative transposase